MSSVAPREAARSLDHVLPTSQAHVVAASQGPSSAGSLCVSLRQGPFPGASQPDAVTWRQSRPNYIPVAAAVPALDRNVDSGARESRGQDCAPDSEAAWPCPTGSLSGHGPAWPLLRGLAARPPPCLRHRAPKSSRPGTPHACEHALRPHGTSHRLLEQVPCPSGPFCGDKTKETRKWWEPSAFCSRNYYR